MIWDLVVGDKELGIGDYRLGNRDRGLGSVI